MEKRLAVPDARGQVLLQVPRFGCADLRSRRGRVVSLAYSSSLDQDRPGRSLAFGLKDQYHIRPDAAVDLQLEHGNTLSHFAFILRHSAQLFLPAAPFVFSPSSTTCLVFLPPRGLTGLDNPSPLLCRSVSPSAMPVGFTSSPLNPNPIPASANPASTSFSAECCGPLDRRRFNETSPPLCISSGT